LNIPPSSRDLCEGLELLTPYILARSGPLVVAVSAPGPGASGDVREALCDLLLGVKPRAGGLTLVRALSLFYGGLTLYYHGDDVGTVLLSRILPGTPVSLVERPGCTPPSYTPEALLRLSSKLEVVGVKAAGVLSGRELASLALGAWVHLAPHHGYGVPVKLVEALRLGKPVVATKNASWALEGLRSGVNIYLVENPRDSCRGLEELEGDGELYNTIALGAREYSKLLEPRRLASKLAGILRDASKRRPPGGWGL